MAFNKNVLFAQIKSNFKFIFAGIAAIAFLSFGFIIAIGLITVLIIAIPIFRFWNSYKANKRNRNSKNGHDIDDFIDVDYEIIESKNKEK